jgi:hypothetical protein
VLEHRDTPAALLEGIRAAGAATLAVKVSLAGHALEWFAPAWSDAAAFIARAAG